MIRDMKVTITVEAEQVIAAIEALTMTLRDLGLVAAYPALLSERPAKTEECDMIQNMLVAQREIGYRLTRGGIETVVESIWTDQSRNYTVECPNGMRLVQDTRPHIDIPPDQLDNNATSAIDAFTALSKYPPLSPERLAEARIDTPTPIDLFAELSKFTPLPDDYLVSICDFGRRVNESQTILEELAHCITTMPWLDWIAVPPLSPEERAKVTSAVRRLKIAIRLADSFPYSAHDIMPLVNITEDEALIRSVLGDYVGQKDGLARARETLLAMREDERTRGREMLVYLNSDNTIAVCRPYSRSERFIRAVGQRLHIRRLARYHEIGVSIGIALADAAPGDIVTVQLSGLLTVPHQGHTGSDLRRTAPVARWSPKDDQD